MRDDIVAFFDGRPVLLLLVIVGAGMLLGRIKIAGVALGPAAALFCGLAVSAWDDRLALPEVFATLGLVLFAYTVGLAAGPQMRAIFGRRGLRMAGAISLVLTVTALIALGVGELVDRTRPGSAGLFAGALTNTPALAAVVAEHPDGAATVSYSLAYPVGVIGPLLGVAVLMRRRRREPTRTAEASSRREPVISWTIRVSRALPPLGELRTWKGAALAFSRYEHDGTVGVATAGTQLAPGDLVTAIGAEDAIRRFAAWCGERADRHLPLDRREFDFRRVVLSRHEHEGKRLGDLDLADRFGATVTRVRRGDVDFVARDDLVLLLGDRLRVVGPRERLEEVSAYLGDSLHGLADIDLAGLALGIVAGMLVGRIGIPLPGGTTLRLGDAGGVLIVGMFLGARARIWKLSFALPVEENLVLRNFGTAVVLAAIGSRSGSAFADAIGGGDGLMIMAAGVAVTAAGVVLMSLAARRWLRMEPAESSGLLAGFHTQPAVLASAQARADDPTPVGLGYAMAYPVAMIVKLLLAQILAG